jgi:CubicO group peptidase (beta-lactamase class C family)
MELPGAVVAIARRGKLAYLEAIGFQDREKQVPMAADSIFRLASLSKPITSVALMMLAEEGKVDVAAPAWRYLPEFKELKVGVEAVGAASGVPELAVAPAHRVMTVQDLLRHTSGLTYGFFGKSFVKQAYVDAKVGDSGDTLAEFVGKLAKLPLAHEPGTTWDYSHSTDVLGRIVEVASGMSFDAFVERRITGPLGMTDTGFHVPEAKLARLAEPQVDPATGRRPAMRNVAVKPRLLSGGGGMVGTALDYLRFAEMLLEGGALDGVRLLSPRTVAMMTADQLPPGVAYMSGIDSWIDVAPTPQMGQGFGLGFAVRTAAGGNPLPGSVGTFYWVGATGTVFWVDPREALVAVMMIQAPIAEIAQYRHEIRYLVYQALTD